MDIKNFGFTILVVFLIGIQEIRSTKEVQTTQQQDETSNLILDENEIGDVYSSGDHTKETSSRVKRQVPVPVPVKVLRPVMIPGGQDFGFRGFEGRGGFGGLGSGGFGGFGG